MLWEAQAAARGAGGGRAVGAAAVPRAKAAAPVAPAPAAAPALPPDTPLQAAAGGGAGAAPTYLKPTSASKARVGQLPAAAAESGPPAFDYVPN
jgi:hypothetical protein